MNLPKMKNLTLIIIFLLTHNLSAQITNDSLPTKVDNIFQKYNTKSSPGIAVAIIRNGQVVYKNNYGMANLEYDTPITSSTVFDVASLAKQFTGFAISTLVQEGKINLDDDIRKYLPQVPKFRQTIRINHLLHHTSGIRDWAAALTIAGWRYTELATFDDIVRMVKNQKDLDFEPGSQYSYSNTGYNLLAAIVEKVSGKSFREWTDERIFKPLKMNTTHFVDDNNKMIKNLAYSYYFENNEFFKYPNVLSAYGSSSLYTSLDDLIKWAIFFQKAISENEPKVLRMLGKGKLKNNDAVNYGFGLELVSDENNLNEIYHSGAWSGFRTVIKHFPHEQISIIILSNANDDYTIGSANSIADLLPTKLRKTTSNTDLPIFKVDRFLLKKYVGVYEWGLGELNITLENDQLMFQFTNEPKFPLQALSDSKFLLSVAGQTLTFNKDSDGNVSSFIFKSEEGKKLNTKVVQLKPLNQYVGIYYSEELSAEYRVDISNSKLIIHHFRRGDFELIAHKNIEDLFTGDVGRLQFYRNTRQQVIGFNLNSGSARNIRFGKVRFTTLK
jgi:CubicO group peptidase (beta-lactamase class C family)